MDKDNQGHVFDNVLCCADGAGRAGFQKTGLTIYGKSTLAKLNISIVGYRSNIKGSSDYTFQKWRIYV